MTQPLNSTASAVKKILDTVIDETPNLSQSPARCQLDSATNNASGDADARLERLLALLKHEDNGH